jgi:hypothetical protein
MKQEITFSQFCDGFTDSYKEHFSYEGKRALFDYLEDYEESTDETINYDPIALCVEYTEYENLQELQANYNNIETIEDLQDRTQYIPIMNNDGTESERFIIQDF